MTNPSEPHNPSPNCLLVEDDLDMQVMVAQLLQRKGLTVCSVNSLLQATQALNRQTYSLCLLDMHLGDGDGLQLLEYIQALPHRLPVIIVTAYGNVPTAVQALKQGADNFIDKPIKPDVLYQAIDDALDAQTANPPRATENLPLPLIGHSPAVKRLRRQVLQWKRLRMPVFLSGLRDSGRVKIVEYFHLHGAPPTSHIAKISQTRLDGHHGLEELNDLLRLDRQRQDNIGTLVIDEVDQIPDKCWAELSRFIRRQHRSPPSGGDARLILVGQKTPQELAEQRSTRISQTLAELEPFHLPLPSLVERMIDGELLMQTLLNKHARTNQDIRFKYTGKTQKWLREFAKNNQLMALDRYLRQYLATWPSDAPITINLTVPELKQQEFELLNTLERFRWNRTRAAHFLGLSLRQLRYRLGKIKGKDRSMVGHDHP